jgi:hypothetical protein
MIQNTANFFGGIFIVGKRGISYNENDYREVSLEGVSYDDQRRSKHGRSFHCGSE